MKLAFALEYSLGHATHAENLKVALKSFPDIEPSFVDIPYENTPLPAFWRRLGPVQSNWSLRASLCASHGLRACRDADALFFNTQVTSLLSARLMRRIPSVISLDATPVQYDSLGEFYGHSAGAGPMETVKMRLNQRAFAAAKHLVTWSQWAKDSLVADYGVAAEKITVIPPGIDLSQWTFERIPVARPIRLLFVGGDFERKGGIALLDAFREVREKAEGAELHIVTKSADAGDGEPGVTVHRGLTPNSAPLLKLYETCDIFAFPTRGDCLPLAVMEALASGLPVITTRVGALPEAVEDGRPGIVVDIDSPRQLASAVLRLAGDRAMLAAMSANARQAACRRFDAATNYRRLIELLKSTAAGPAK